MKILSFLLVIFLQSALFCAPASFAKSKFSAMAIDADTGEVLFQVNPDHIGHPASLTKIFTLKMIFDALSSGKISLNQMIKVSRHAANQRPTKLGIRAGGKISCLDAILGLVTHSANDVAAAVAEFLGGSEENFARMMTLNARSLGMRNTIFKNASGLPNPEQITTARDMATLTRHLIDNYEPYLEYFATTSFYFKGRNYHNHNKLLGRVEGVDCCKTGFTNASGWNLVASAKRGDKRIIGVILGGHTRVYRDAQMTRLLNSTFKKLHLSFPEQSHLYEEDEVALLVDEIVKSPIKINKKPSAKKCAKPAKKKRA